jgi:hypothetical protein
MRATSVGVTSPSMRNNAKLRRIQRIANGSRSPKRNDNGPCRMVPLILTVAAIAVACSGLLSFRILVLDDGHQPSARGRNGPPSSTTGRQSDPIYTVSRCKYHGNCPVHTVCEDGLCLPYMGKPLVGEDDIENNNARISHCVDVCVEELRTDEWYFHEMEPTNVRHFGALNGHGCVVRYERTKPSPKTPKPTLEEWMQGRFRRVVRVDPAPPNPDVASSPKSSSSQAWVALCDLPCTSDADCPTEDKTICTGRPERDIPPPIISAFPGSCRKPSVTKQQQLAPDMVVVSAANEQYFPALKNLAASVKFWSPERQIVVYNLGMTESQLEDVKTWSNLRTLKWEEGIPQSLPPHFNELKNYAWKPTIINETVHKYRSIVWADSGSTFTGPILQIEDILRWSGIFLVKGQDEDMKPMSHEGTYQWLGSDKGTFRTGLNSPHFGGSVQGYVFPSRYIDSIVIPNAQCALDPNCITPIGSSLSNHRYDQTSMSILAYKEDVQAPHYTEYLAAGSNQLNPDLSQPSHRMLMWTSRGACSHYSNMVGFP